MIHQKEYELLKPGMQVKLVGHPTRIMVEDMEEWLGKIVTVSIPPGASIEACFGIEEDEGWYWDIECIDYIVYPIRHELDPITSIEEMLVFK